MKFNAKELRHLTFPKGTLGYKKKDVDDFLLVASKDYFEYEKKIHNFEEEREELNETVASLKGKVQAQEKEMAALNQQLTDQMMMDRSVVSSVKAVYGENLQDYSLVQQVALSIEEEAMNEYTKKMAEATKYYTQQVEEIKQEKKEMAQEREKMSKQLEQVYTTLFPLLEQSRKELLLSIETLNVYDQRNEGE